MHRLIAWVLLFAFAAASAAPPVAPVRPVSDDYFGTRVVDAYRYMEDLQDPEVQAWIKAQAGHARATLDALPLRAAFAERVGALAGASDTIENLRLTPDGMVYLRRPAGASAARLYWRGRTGGAERVLVDPAQQAGDGRAFAIGYFQVSPDGRRIAYALAPNDSEDPVLQVIETASGRALPDRIEHAWPYGGLRWHPDGKAFYYIRRPPAAAGAPSQAARLRVHLHTLGRDPASDPAVFGYGVSPEVAVAEHETPWIAPLAGTPFVLGLVNPGTNRASAIYVSRAPAAGAPFRWRRLAALDDAIADYAVHGRDIYLLSAKGAPRYRVLRTRLDAPDVARAEVALPSSEAVIEEIAAAKDALYARVLDGGLSRIVRVAWNGGAPADVPLPQPGTVQWIAARPDRPGVLFPLESWTRAPAILARDGRGRPADTGLLPPARVPFADIVAEEVKVRSADGTPVPLSIIHRRDIEQNGANPTRLEGYGAFGWANPATFEASDLAWLERGGVIAVAHVRGGGEYGEEWHRAGMKEKKLNSMTDFIACAEHLVEQRYTSPAFLAARGVSAGGILIGRVLTMRPDLFGAAVIHVGVVNALRFAESDTSALGPGGAAEIGSAKDAAGFAALQAMDAYLHVEDGVHYPAVLLTTGMNDARVPPWQMAKLAARLQAASRSGKPVLLRVDYATGHGLGATAAQAAAETADVFAFLADALGLGRVDEPAPIGSR